MTTHEAGTAFDGETYSQELDQERLSSQYWRVWTVMSRGGWWTLAEIAHQSQAFGYKDTEAGISARIRDFRKARNGSHRVFRELRRPALWEYQLRENKGVGPQLELLP